MPIHINEIRITASVSEEEGKQHQHSETAEVDVNKIVALAVEAILDKLKELKED